VPTGVADQRDNHRVINNTAAIVAQFRESFVGPPPPNDNFADASALVGGAGIFTGTNNGATREPGEPNFGFIRGGASVWFTWQAPAGGPTTLTTAGSTFNTHLTVYTGGGLSGLSFVAHNDDVDTVAGTSRVTINATAGTIYRIAVDGYGGATGSLRLGWSQAGSPVPTVQLGSAAFVAGEPDRKVLVNVTRAGDTSSAASASYATEDGTAGRRGDYTQTLGTLSFAPGETSKTVTVFITDDVNQEGPESFTFTLANASGAMLGAPASAVVTIDSDDDATTPVPNPVGEAGFNADFFVRQHYVDFLNREVDAQGLAFWANEIVSCGVNAQCAAAKRVNVSAAFFLSIEFQETGFLVYRAHKAAYGDLPGKPVPITLRSFLADQRQLANNVIIGTAGWPEQLEANKTAYFTEFVRRPAFIAVNPLSLTAEQYVDGLFNRAGVRPAQDERGLAIAFFGGGGTSGRAAALRSVAESQTVKQAETNRAFVLMQYFGYLRRDPDDTDFRGNPDPQFLGYNFWLTKLNQFNGNFADAEMVKAFIQSIEYGQRFKR
jgi:hypothetical protein